MTNRSMTVTDMNLDAAIKSLEDVKRYLQESCEHDPDPEITGARFYPQAINNVELLTMWCTARRIAGQPDLERERAS